MSTSASPHTDDALTRGRFVRALAGVGAIAGAILMIELALTQYGRIDGLFAFRGRWGSRDGRSRLGRLPAGIDRRGERRRLRARRLERRSVDLRRPGVARDRRIDHRCG